MGSLVVLVVLTGSSFERWLFTVSMTHPLKIEVRMLSLNLKTHLA